MNILITGGASGLGSQILLKLAKSGHTVYFTYNKSANEAGVLEKENPGCRGFQCDFHDAASIDGLLSALNGLTLDVLINNALPSLKAVQFQRTNVDDLVSSFALNVIPILHITQACLSIFRKQRSGRIITILTSYLINRPPVGYSEYVANKAYLHAMSKAWAVENAKFGIAVNCISPSIMRTGLTSDTDDRVLDSLAASNPFGRLVEPSEVAELVEFLVKAPLQLNSSNFILNGGADVI
ncbi:SDR family oxidoreductase [Candidatus Methylospira mobilis]|uniref:SDR family oxidoreductase n=1 Tax=Candidatus Methylospira mobilis TaxID=1808979 RepID=A0A5Q0BBR2_9GAMM|nr:SDR family oxidoreductase [Candidatus Methylospira mobilis]QFY41383.1 SDR family oxidoreductase [Candidatus Methylospira mobilis]